MNTRDVELQNTVGIGCARCGETHENLEVRTFRNPVAPAELAPFEWTQWATCPVTGDPILIGVGHATDAAVLEQHAQNAYAAYGQSTGGKNFRGEPMPTWEALPAAIQTAWRASVKAVLR